MRPLVADPCGKEALLWMQGLIAAYTDFDTSVVGLIRPISVPEPTSLGLSRFASLASPVRRRR